MVNLVQGELPVEKFDSMGLYVIMWSNRAATYQQLHLSLGVFWFK